VTNSPATSGCSSISCDIFGTVSSNA